MAVYRLVVSRSAVNLADSGRWSGGTYLVSAVWRAPLVWAGLNVLRFLVISAFRCTQPSRLISPHRASEKPGYEDNFVSTGYRILIYRNTINNLTLNPSYFGILLL